MNMLMSLGAAAILAAGLAVPDVYAREGGGGMHHGGGGGIHVGGGGGGANVIAPRVRMGNPGTPRAGGFVQRGPRVSGNTAGNWNGGNRHSHHHRGHGGRYLAYGSPFYDYDYGYSSYSGDCGYYWQRYQDTGSLSWKRRYYQCVE